MDSHLALKHTLQAAQQHDQALLRLNRLHSKLSGSTAQSAGDNGNKMSAKATVKLLLAYESAIKTCQALQQSAEHGREKMTQAAAVASEQATFVAGMELDVHLQEEPLKQAEPAIVGPLVETEEAEIHVEEEHVTLEESFIAPRQQPSTTEDHIQTVTFSVGRLVAVLCRVDDDSETDEWMLATIVKHLDDGTYEVEDCELIDETQASPGAEAETGSSSHTSPSSQIVQSGQGKRRIVLPDRILALPESKYPEESQELKPKTAVLGLYPGTTCLYPALVISSPSRRKKSRDYLLKFADDEVPSRPCPARYVIAAPSSPRSD